MRLCFALLLLVNIAWPALHIELTNNQLSAMPVWLVASSEVATDIPEIIGQDFQNSGQLSLVSHAPAQLGVLSSVDKSWMQAEGIAHYIDIQSASGGKLWVRYWHHRGGAWVLEWSSLFESQRRQRHFAHDISDKLYQQILHRPSIFKTKLAYVETNAQPGQGKLPSIYRLMVSDYDGGDPKPLLESHLPIMSPAWSPDGKSLAYVSFERHRSHIFLSHLSTGHRQLVVSLPGINGAPAFSHDGRMLAMVLSHRGQAKIYSFDFLSKKLLPLTTGLGIDTEPEWLNGDKGLIFTSDRGGSPQIYRIDRRGEHIERLTYEGRYNARARWAGDDAGMALLNRDENGYHIGWWDARRSRLRLLTQGSNVESPTLSPDGQLIAYVQSDGEGSGLHVISRDARVRWDVPSSTGVVQEPAWSPFL